MIDKSLVDKSISFELSMGNYGNQIDGMYKSNARAPVITEPDSDDDSDKVRKSYKMIS